jgi:lipoate-protein ligase A
MAADETMLMALAEGTVRPTLRFYGWNPPAVSIGYFQKLDEEIDRAACARLGIDVVRRLTGGRAVLHEAEVTYSLVVREDSSGIPSTVTGSYLFFSQAIVAGLDRLGISAQLQQPEISTARNKGQSSSSACFDAPSHHEIIVSGRKVVGSAQVRHNGILLQHGSVSLTFRAERMTAIMKFDNEANREYLTQVLNVKAIGLSDILGKSLGFDEVVSALKDGFVEKCGFHLLLGGRSSLEMDRLEQLVKNKYCGEAWNCLR